MAIIANTREVPQREPYEGLPQILENQVIHFASRTGDNKVHLAPNMVLSMMATAIARNGSPVPASELVEIHRIGIFAAWDWGKKLGQLAEMGYFTRMHFGTEEWFFPDSRFHKYVEETTFEIKSPVV